MGEKKARLARMRAEALGLLEAWSFEPTQWERETVAEVGSLATVTVMRVEASLMAKAGMKPRLCFSNADWQVQQDPTGRTSLVLGWIAEPEGNYVLHAVVHRDGQYWDWTPPDWHMSLPPTYTMIPDSKLVQTLVDGRYIHTRDGHRLTQPGIRRNPERTTAALAEIRERLETELDPSRAFPSPISTTVTFRRRSPQALPWQTAGSHSD